MDKEHYTKKVRELKRRKASTRWLSDFYFSLSSYYILAGDKANGESLSSLINFEPKEKREEMAFTCCKEVKVRVGS